MNKILLSAAVLVGLSICSDAQVGGTYDLSHSVIASGGGSNSAGGVFRVDGTVGQGIAGTTSVGTSATGSRTIVRGGFWASIGPPLTAAQVSVSGSVRTRNGSGIRGVTVSLTDDHGLVRTTQTGSFGYFRFEDVPSGRSYILTVAARRFGFDPNTKVIDLVDDLSDVDFIGDPTLVGRVNKL